MAVRRKQLVVLLLQGTDVELKVTSEFPSEDLIRIVQNDPNSTPTELELARRLAETIDILARDILSLKSYNAKVSRSLAKTVQVLTSC